MIIIADLRFFVFKKRIRFRVKRQIKIVKKCDLPLTAYKEVNVIITERCVLEVTPEGLLLTEINPMYTVDDIKSSVSADFIVADNLKYMEI